LGQKVDRIRNVTAVTFWIFVQRSDLIRYQTSDHNFFFAHNLTQSIQDCRRYLWVPTAVPPRCKISTQNRTQYKTPRNLSQSICLLFLFPYIVARFETVTFSNVGIMTETYADYDAVRYALKPIVNNWHALFVSSIVVTSKKRLVDHSKYVKSQSARSCRYRTR
jgi:hypothetical protein